MSHRYPNSIYDLNDENDESNINGKGDPDYTPTTYSTKNKKERYWDITTENYENKLTEEIRHYIMKHEDTKILKLKKVEEAEEAKEVEDDLEKIFRKHTTLIPGEKYYGEDSYISYQGPSGLETYPVSDILVVKNKHKREYPFIYNINEVISADPADWGSNIPIHSKGYKVFQSLSKRPKLDKNSRSLDNPFDISFI